MDCSICFDELRKGPVVVLPCDHVFHELCIVKWSRYKMSCPHCRTEYFLEIHVPQPDPLRIVTFLVALVYLLLFVSYFLNGIEHGRVRS